jgi:hypothetical protein
MEFKGTYLLAMREQAPKMFMELRRSGKLDQHLQEKSTEAHQMLRELLAQKPRTARGDPYVSDQHWAEEIVRATLIEFKERARNPEPSHNLPREIGKALRQPQSRQSTEPVTSETTDPADCWFCPMHRAVLQYADIAFHALARKIVGQIQQIDATGIYGDDYQHKTLWDEYCHKIQEGSEEPSEYAWEWTISPFLAEIVENTPHEMAVLLTVGAEWRIGEEESEQIGGLASNPDLMRRYLAQVVTEMAAARDMSQFNPGEGGDPE